MRHSANVFLQSKNITRDVLQFFDLRLLFITRDN